MSGDDNNKGNYYTNFAKDVLIPIAQSLAEEKLGGGQAHYDRLVLTIIASTFSTLIYDRLKSIELDSETGQPTDAAYFKFKQDIQNAISAGFSSAFAQFSKTDTEYFCQILPVPPPVNKMPC